MKSNIFVPKTINVGYQNRSGTYTGKLAYIIYTDEKGVLRKEGSWNSWRDHNIEPNTFDNEPTSGFVLNKKVGDTCSHWNFRQAYCRVYDPRGFEFEITIENLLYILENTNSIVGKGLDGEFVYGWDGKDLVLLPTCSADYKEIESYSKTVLEAKSITGKMLVVGNTYLGKDGNHYVYLGKHLTYTYFSYSSYVNISSCQEEDGKQFWFAVLNSSNGIKANDIDRSCLLTKRSISKGFLIDVIDENPHPLLSTFIDLMEHSSTYSPVDITATKIILLTKEEFKQRLQTAKERGWYNMDMAGCTSEGYKDYTLGFWKGLRLNLDGAFYYQNKTIFEIPDERSTYAYDLLTDEVIDKIYELVHPIYIELYLKNGNKYSTEYTWHRCLDDLNIIIEEEN